MVETVGYAFLLSLHLQDRKDANCENDKMKMFQPQRTRELLAIAQGFQELECHTVG